MLQESGSNDRFLILQLRCQCQHRLLVGKGLLKLILQVAVFGGKKMGQDDIACHEKTFTAPADK